MTPELRRLIEVFGRDDKSGSFELARKALNIIRQAAVEIPGNLLREELVEVSKLILRSQPSMAAVINIVNRAALAVEKVGDYFNKTVIDAALEELLEGFDRSAEETVANAVEKLSDFDRIAAYSRSSLVERALLTLKDKKGSLSAAISEARPGLEGVTLAAMLSGHGVKTELCVDAALPGLIETCDALVVGADAVGERSFSNKIGSGMMCKAAREKDIPVFVIAASDKFLTPPLRRFYKILDRPAEEITGRLIPGIQVINRLFEWCDNKLVTAFIAGGETLSPIEVTGKLITASISWTLEGIPDLNFRRV